MQHQRWPPRLEVTPALGDIIKFRTSVYWRASAWEVLVPFLWSSLTCYTLWENGPIWLWRWEKMKNKTEINGVWVLNGALTIYNKNITKAYISARSAQREDNSQCKSKQRSFRVQLLLWLAPAVQPSPCQAADKQQGRSNSRRGNKKMLLSYAARS